MYNIEILYKARKEVITLYDDCSLISSETQKRATKGTGLKTLTSKQLPQRLPIALALVKAGNNSQSLLFQIREIVYSLHHSTQITKKSYNSKIKSM